MAWQLKEHYLDRHIGRHYIKLHDTETGAEHHVVIYTSHDSCPACGHVKPKTNLGEIDYRQIVKNEIEALEQGNKQTKEYGVKHNIPVLRADGSKR